MSIPWSSGTTVFASAQRTTLQTSADIPVQWAARGIDVPVDITVNAGGSASLTITISGKDPASGKYYTLLQSSALSSVATTILRVGVGITAGTNAANFGIPSIIQIAVAVGNASPATYSIGLNLIS